MKSEYFNKSERYQELTGFHDLCARQLFLFSELMKTWHRETGGDEAVLHDVTQNDLPAYAMFFVKEVKPLTDLYQRDYPLIMSHLRDNIKMWMDDKEKYLPRIMAMGIAIDEIVNFCRSHGKDAFPKVTDPDFRNGVIYIIIVDKIMQKVNLCNVSDENFNEIFELAMEEEMKQLFQLSEEAANKLEA